MVIKCQELIRAKDEHLTHGGASAILPRVISFVNVVDNDEGGCLP